MVQNALLEMHPENLHTISDRIIIILFGSYFLFGSVQAQNAQKVSKNILKMIFGMQHYFKPARWNMEDNINFFENERNKFIYFKWKTISFEFGLRCLLMEDNLHFFKWKMTSFGENSEEISSVSLLSPA